MDIILFLFIFAINFLLLKISIPIFSKFLLDDINFRSSHQIPKPRGGGIFLALSFLIISLFNKDINFLFSIPLILICFLDDIRGVSSKLKFSVQILSLAGLFIVNKDIYLSWLPFKFFLPFFILYIFFGTSILNLVNFMDGVDGIVAGSFSLVFFYSSLFLKSESSFILSGLLPFLYFNWQPSKIFLGDVGSIFIGYLFFIELINSKSYEEFLVLILITSPIFFDAAITVLRRLFCGRNIFSAHKENLYQRLNQEGFSHASVSLIYIGSILILILSYEFWGIEILFFTSVLILLFGYYLDKYKAASF